MEDQYTSAAMTKVLFDEMKDWENFNLLDTYTDIMRNAPNDLRDWELRDWAADRLRDEMTPYANMSEAELDRINWGVVADECAKSTQALQAQVGEANYVVFPGDVSAAGGLTRGAVKMWLEDKGAEIAAKGLGLGAMATKGLTSIWNPAHSAAKEVCEVAVKTMKVAAKAMGNAARNLINPEIEPGPADPDAMTAPAQPRQKKSPGMRMMMGK